jgi:hypothetical protein
LAGGCRLDRDSAAAIRAAGFGVERIDTFGFSGVTHVIGEAHIPSSST